MVRWMCTNDAAQLVLNNFHSIGKTKRLREKNNVDFTDRRTYSPGPDGLISTENYQQRRFRLDRASLHAFHACCYYEQTYCPKLQEEDHRHRLALI